MRTLLLLMALVLGQAAYGQETCTPYNTIMYGGGVYATGNATVTNDADNLYVQVTSNTVDGWAFKNVFVYAGTDPVPESGGVPLPGFFPFQFVSPDSLTDYTMTIPLTSVVGGACGVPLNVAIYSVMRRYDALGNEVQAELGWAYGPNAFAVEGWWFNYTPCCQDVGNEGCTLSTGYYKTHNAFAKKLNKIPWLIPETTLLCGKRWIDIMNTTPKTGDAWTILAQQWVAARLNEAFGATTGAIIDEALVESETILTSNCRTLPKTGTTRQTALEYSLLLETYNKGLAGPEMCVQQ